VVAVLAKSNTFWYVLQAMQLTRLFFIPDCHVPYHDRRATDLVLKVLAAFKPNVVVTLGDLFDFYAVSNHSKDPNRAKLLEWEVSCANQFLDRLDRFKIPRKIFIEGNHEFRLERYLRDKAPELYGLVNVQKLFNLRGRGWDFVAYKAFTKIGKLHLTHDTGRSGKYTAAQTLTDVQDNVVVGHAHRLQYVVEGNAKGKPHVSACFGWLGDRDKTDYMHKVRANRDWALGFGVGYLEPASRLIHLVPVPLVNYTCVVEGKLYKG